MNDLDLINRNSREIVSTGANPFASYGAKVGQTGQFLSFKNGEFLAGQNAEELKLGTRLVANMPGLRIGWRRWFGAQVTDDLTELLVDQVPVRPRTELGNNDPALWEKDDRGEPRDPWQLTNILELSDGEETYIYSTGSKGGIRAVGRLCTAYGKERRQRPGMLPIITLGRDFYNHPKFGKTYFPKFEIVGWTDEAAPSVNGEAEEEGLPENMYVDRNGDVQKKPGQRAENPTQAAAAASESAPTTQTMTSPSEGARKATRF